MKDKVLKLCRRLKSCTLEDLVSFLETDSAIIETVLLGFLYRFDLYPLIINLLICSLLTFQKAY